MRSIFLSIIFYCCFFFAGCTQSRSPLEKTFRLAWENVPRSIDPRYTIDADSQYLEDFIHCSLISFDRLGQMTKSLASGMRWIDSKTLEVTLRRGVYFSNNQEITAQDVQANFDFYIKKEGERSPHSANFSDLKSVEVVQKDQLLFHLSQSNGDFTTLLSLGLLPQKLAAGARISDPKKIIGCGAFQIEEWAVGHILLKRRDLNSSKEVKYIHIAFVKDENTRFLKLRNSELDLVQNSINRDQLGRIQDYKHLRLLRAPGMNTTYLGFQYSDPILRDQRVRLAIAHSIDRKKIIEHIFHGWAIPATTILAPFDRYFNPSLKPLKYDVNEAMRLLDAAGFPRKGRDLSEPRFTLKLKTTTNATRLMVAHALAEEFRRVGIALEIESMDWGKFKSDVDQGNAQLWNLNWIGIRGPDIYRFAFSTESIPPYGANRGRVSHPQLDQLVLKARAEIDFEKRRLLYNQAQEIVNEEVPYVFLWHEDQYAVVHQRVKNYELYADGRLVGIENVSFSAEK